MLLIKCKVVGKLFLKVINKIRHHLRRLILPNSWKSVQIVEK